MEIISMLAGPVIGAVIGYCTNYIAVKMLFKPHNPVMLGSFRLPFTPGIIPKRKSALARAIGEAVEKHLFTGDDIGRTLFSEPVKNKLVGSIVSSLEQMDDNCTAASVGAKALGAARAAEIKGNITDLITDRLLAKLIEINIGEQIAAEGGRIVEEKLKGSMLSMFLSSAKINSFIAPMAEHINEFVAEKGREKLLPVVAAEVDNICATPIKQGLGSLGLGQEQITDLLNKVYEDFLSDKLAAAAAEMNIAGVVQERIEAMDMAEMEALVFSVMKRELNAIVNLGALIGFIIGILVIFIK